MVHLNKSCGWLVVTVLASGLLSSCSFRKHKYDNPISKDTKQPDKVLFDKAMADVERNRFEVARLTLNTLMNTYDTSEYMAKAKLLLADSWFREGGGHGLAQAEAEYKDFILFYPTMEESAEAQQKICMIHYRQMEKADRDMMHAQRAEDECRSLLVQFPNSKFAPQTAQLLRNIQEVLAENEYRVGSLYDKKGSYAASTNRFKGMTEAYPLYSNADEALYKAALGYSKMGPRTRSQAGEAYAKLVRDYPLSPRVEEAKKALKTLELPVPEADPVAYNRQKYELENRTKQGVSGKALNSAMGLVKRGPDTRTAAKSGAPAMQSLRPQIPVTVPVGTADAAAGGTNDVAVGVVTDSTDLNNKPDARGSKQVGAAAATDPSAVTPTADTPATPPADAKSTPPEKGKKKSKKTKTTAAQ